MDKSLKSFAKVEAKVPPPDPPRARARTRGACGGALRFETVPNPGTLLSLDQQDYELRGTEPYQRQNGTTTTLLVWESTCPNCGEPFEVRSTLNTRWLSRRCADCAKPGKPVKGRRGRKIKVKVAHA